MFGSFPVPLKCYSVVSKPVCVLCLDFWVGFLFVVCLFFFYLTSVSSVQRNQFTILLK